eukprot:scaffold24289_cov17-Tisochrysis_lutea.AAC.2
MCFPVELRTAHLPHHMPLQPSLPVHCRVMQHQNTEQHPALTNRYAHECGMLPHLLHLQPHKGYACAKAFAHLQPHKRECSCKDAFVHLNTEADRQLAAIRDAVL